MRCLGATLLGLAVGVRRAESSAMNGYMSDTRRQSKNMGTLWPGTFAKTKGMGARFCGSKGEHFIPWKAADCERKRHN